jgi:eukaryotic-like serine/threonine-protein kinase
VRAVGAAGRLAPVSQPVPPDRTPTLTSSRELVGGSVDATLRAAPPDVKPAASPSLSPISFAFLDRALAPDGLAAERGDADFLVTGRLGQGGMSTVFLARQRSLAREVAVKTMRETAEPAARRTSLVSEALITGSLEHPNIVPVHALGCDGARRPVLVMKRIEGAAWRDLLDDPAHPAWSRQELAGEDRLTINLRILMQVVTALEYAHSRGVIHRDVKPSNVMIGAFGEVYLVDWGIALVRGQAQGARLVGTPGYMAPEMVGGRPDEADERTDVYLLGSTLHYVLTGKRRHDAAEIETALSLAQASSAFEYGPEVPAELAALCNAATSPDKDRRPKSASAFRQAIAAYLHHRSSIEIARSAQAKLDDLERRLASGPGASLEAVDTALRLAECRFGFIEALRAWSGNQPAARGLRACRVRMVERELALRNTAAARAWLAELEPPDPELAARVAALEAELDATRKRAWSMDPSVLWAPRVLMLTVFLAGALVANLFTTIKEIRTGVATPMQDVLLTDGLQLAAVAIALAVTGRRLWTHQYNRRVIGVLVVATLVVTLIDLAAWLRHVGSRTANLIDCIAMIACFAVATIGVEAGWWRIVALWIVTALVAAFVPVLANGLASLATVLTVVIGILVARASSRARGAAGVAAGG